MTDGPTSLARSEAYEDVHGKRLFTAAAGVVVLRAEGRATEAHASEMTDLLDGTGGPIHLFVDFSALRSYESATRAHATNWCAQNVSRLASVHILSSPGIVAMGVATTTMALSVMGLNAKAYSQEAPFRQAIEATKGEVTQGEVSS